MIVTFDIPDPLVAELNDIATARGFANAKAMLKHYIRQILLNDRLGSAQETTQTAVETTLDADVGTIT